MIEFILRKSHCDINTKPKETQGSECVSRSVVSDSWLIRPLCPWNSSGKNTGLGSHSLLQGTFLTQGLNPGLSHCRQILYHLSHQGSPLIIRGHYELHANKLDNLVSMDKFLEIHKY